MNSKLRIVPLGGLGEIGKNMTVIEYGEDIIVIDAGIMFPENDMFGVDAIIPDFNYLMDKLDRVRAILITHGHEDHVGALPHLMTSVRAPIYATPLTSGLIEGRLGRMDSAHQVELITFEAGDVLNIAAFQIEPFHVAHSIPDCVGFGIRTPVGLIVHTGDYKFDHTPADGWPPDFAKLAEFSEQGVLCLLADSTNADRAGWTPSEMSINDAFDQVFREAPGRIVVATFASLISRIQQVADTAARHGRRLAITGRSMRDNTKIARKMGYLDIDEALLIDIEQAVKLPDHQVTVMATGAQGEPSAVLSRLARGRHHRMRIKEGDTVVFSAHAIPGNEEMVHRVINQLFRRGANVVYEPIANVHVSGHASREEMKLMINLVKPKFLVPIHGELRHLKQHASLAHELGFTPDRVAVVENGTPLEVTADSLTICPRLKGGYVFVDGSGVGDIGWPVMRQRDKLAQNGFLVAVVRRSTRGELIGRPEVVSSGIVGEQEMVELKAGAQEIIAQVVKTHAGGRDPIDGRLVNALSRYVHEETGKRPFVQVVVN